MSCQIELARGGEGMARTLWARHAKRTPKRTCQVQFTSIRMSRRRGCANCPRTRPQTKKGPDNRPGHAAPCPAPLAVGVLYMVTASWVKTCCHGRGSIMQSALCDRPVRAARTILCPRGGGVCEPVLLLPSSCSKLNMH